MIPYRKQIEITLLTNKAINLYKGIQKMKIKIILSMITIFSVAFIDARQRGARTAPTSSTVVPSPTRSYMGLLTEIRKMPASSVINTNNPFTPLKKEFIDFVMNTSRANELARDFIWALLEAGATLHAPLSGNQQADEILIQRIFAQIQTLMQADGKKINPMQPAESTEPDFYDETTNLFSEDFLKKEVAKRSKNLTSTQLKTALSKEFMPKIKEKWESAGSLFTKSYKASLLPEAGKQITKAVDDASWESGTVGKSEVEFYDSWTDMLNQDYLEQEIKKSLLIDPSGKEAENLKNDMFLPAIMNQWESKGKTANEIKKLRIEVIKQINETIRKLKK
jgi:hypothetical protein